MTVKLPCKFAISLGVLCVLPFQSAAASSSTKATSFFKQAVLESVTHGKEAAALTDFDKAINLDNRQAIFYAHKAALLVHLQEDEEAVDTANMALRLDKQCGLALLAKGKALGRLGQPAEGIAILTSALERDSGSVELLQARARLYMALNQMDKADSDLNQALKKGRSCPLLLDSLSIQERLKNWNRVIEITCEILQKYGKANRAVQSKSLRSRANAYSALKKYSAAIKDLELATRLWPDDIRIHQELLSVYRASGNNQGVAAEEKTIRALQQDM